MTPSKDIKKTTKATPKSSKASTAKATKSPTRSKAPIRNQGFTSSTVPRTTTSHRPQKAKKSLSIGQSIFLQSSLVYLLRF